MHKYSTLKQLTESGKYPFSRNSLQRMFSKRRKNGLDKCSYLFGNKLLIREDLFDIWIENHRTDNLTASDLLKGKELYIDNLPE